MEGSTLISVIDDDESVRESLPALLRELGYAVLAYSSAEQFLCSDSVERSRCLLLDIAMPGMSGPDLQQELRNRATHIPIVFITAQPDRTLRQRLTAQGAVTCLFKPFSEAELLDALHAAVRIR